MCHSCITKSLNRNLALAYCAACMLTTGCATLTAEQKNRIAESRYQEELQANPMLIGNEQAHAELLEYYK